LPDAAGFFEGTPFVSGQRRDDVEEAYANGYRQVPDSESELTEAKRLATRAIDDEPWEKWW
jgi:hypothetical protein